MGRAGFASVAVVIPMRCDLWAERVSHPSLARFRRQWGLSGRAGFASVCGAYPSLARITTRVEIGRSGITTLAAFVAGVHHSDGERTGDPTNGRSGITSLARIRRCAYPWMSEKRLGKGKAGQGKAGMGLRLLSVAERIRERPINGAGGLPCLEQYQHKGAAMKGPHSSLWCVLRWLYESGDPAHPGMSKNRERGRCPSGRRNPTHVFLRAIISVGDGQGKAGQGASPCERKKTRRGGRVCGVIRIRVGLPVARSVCKFCTR